MDAAPRKKRARPAAPRNRRHVIQEPVASGDDPLPHLSLHVSDVEVEDEVDQLERASTPTPQAQLELVVVEEETKPIVQEEKGAGQSTNERHSCSEWPITNGLNKP